jgi:hypothetical protein
MAKNTQSAQIHPSNPIKETYAMEDYERKNKEEIHKEL